MTIRPAFLVHAGLFLACLADAPAHRWTATDGETIEADFAGLESSPEGELLRLVVAGDLELSFPLDTFVEADRQRALDYANGERVRPGGLDVPASVAAQLVVVEDGRWVSTELDGEPEYILLYFSASWCGPCRARAPYAIELYHELKSRRDDFEMIWVSGDRAAEPMREWALAEEFPWPTVGFAHLEGHPLWQLSGGFFPQYLLVDRNGNQLAEGEGAVLAHLAALPSDSGEAAMDDLPEEPSGSAATPAPEESSAGS